MSNIIAKQDAILDTALETIQVVEARLNAATEGPWEIRTSGLDATFADTIYSPSTREAIIRPQESNEGGASWNDAANAQLIVNAPADLRNLIELARAQHAELVRLRAELAK
jgi:peptidoglycan hydrolase-like protein with peptidoglycan-binding domain